MGDAKEVAKGTGQDSGKNAGRDEGKEIGKGGDYRLMVPWLMAAADPDEAWWQRYRRSPKRSGEISQAAFLLKARMLGFNVAMPWGDSERYDFVVWARAGGPMFRVQVKGTGRLHRRGYEVQPVHATRGRGKKRYTAKEIDVVAAHVQPVDVWYLLPLAAVGRAKSLRFYPDIKSRRPMWEEYREAWRVLEGEAVR
jgi:PD-(D/E)XK endonuclease